MRKIIISLAVIFSGFCSASIAQSIASFKDSILQENLRKDILFLCDSKLLSRKFATKGEETVANYIRNQFIVEGLEGNVNEIKNYFQHFTISYDTLISFNIKNKNIGLNYISDFFTWEFCYLHDTTNFELVYAGFGLDREDYSDYKKIDAKNKWVVVEINSPIDSTGKVLDHFDFNQNVNIPEIFEKKEVARKHGASGIIFKINDQKYKPEVLTKLSSNWHLYRSKDDIALNRIIGTFPGINAKMGKIDSLMGVKTNDFDSLINSKLKKKQSPAGIVTSKVSFKVVKQERKFNSQNVIGIIKGKNEKVGIIVSAHYDNKKVTDSLIYPGANDNASGTAAVLQLANVFSKIVRAGYIPDQSIAFVLFSGEEEDLLGSSYFLNNIPFLMDSLTLNINLDCIGILDTAKFKKEGLSIAAPDNIIDQYKESFTGIALKEKQPLSIDFNNYFQYSDNASFTFNGYKAMHLSTGGGEVMHTPQDKPDLFNYDNFENVTRFVFDIIFLKINFNKTT